MLTPRRLSSHTALPTLTRRQDDSRAVKCAPVGASTAPRLPVTVVGHPYTNDKLILDRCMGPVEGTLCVARAGLRRPRWTRGSSRRQGAASFSKSIEPEC
jgi:hypothetical protein